jgi:hypothetical protein
MTANGMLDEFELFYAAFSEPDILAHYNARATPLSSTITGN